MKILVFGAGVIGSYYAARLQDTGNDVTILARGDRYREIRDGGITVEGTQALLPTHTDVAVIDHLDPRGAYDLILVALRRNQVEQALPTLAANRATPSFLFLGNCVAGPGALISALNRDRVLMGFGAVGGALTKGTVRIATDETGAPGRTVLGELDGSTTPRLQRIKQAFARLDSSVVIERNIDDWLKTHAAVVVPLAHAIYAAGGDCHRLVRTRDGLVLAIRAIKELLPALREAGTEITPGYLQAIEWIPEPMTIALLRKTLDSPRAEVGLAAHANVARDEMTFLASELLELIRPLEVPTAALDHLLTFGDPDEPPLLDGRAAVPLNWRGVWVTAGALAGLVLLLRRFFSGA